MRRTRIRVFAVLAATAAVVLGGATAASAHVHVITDTTASGSYAKLTFRVPNESDTASTTKLVVSLPLDTPLLYAAAMPVPGWTVVVAEKDLPKPITVEGANVTKAPATVTWTANSSSAIAPGQFQEFALSAGPLPADATELSFPAAQTYSDGKVVNWNQPEPAGGDEPEYPVPSFTVTAASGDGHGDDDADDAGHAAAAAPETSAGASDDSGNGVAIGLGAAGLVAGLAGLALGAVAFRASRRPHQP